MDDLIEYLKSININSIKFIKKGKHFYLDDIDIQDMIFEFIVDEKMKPIRKNINILKEYGFKCDTTSKNRNGSWANVIVQWPDGLHRFMCG